MIRKTQLVSASCACKPSFVSLHFSSLDLDNNFVHIGVVDRVVWVRTGSMQSFSIQPCGSLQPCVATARPRYGAPHLPRQSSLQTRASAAVAENGAAVRNGVSFQVNDVFPPAEPEPVSPEVQAIINEQGLDYETSGLQYLTNEARVSQYLEILAQSPHSQEKQRGRLFSSHAHMGLPAQTLSQHSNHRAAMLRSQCCIRHGMLCQTLQVLQSACCCWC